MKLDTEQAQERTLHRLDDLTEDTPAIDEFFRQRDISPEGVAQLAIRHGRVAATQPSPPVASLATLFSLGVVLGLVLAEED